eukprot:scaffold15653_cov143-Amphora_coffeaeformis.AAC.2
MTKGTLAILAAFALQNAGKVVGEFAQKTEQSCSPSGSAGVLRGAAQGVEFLLYIRHHSTDTMFEVRQTITDVMHEHIIQRRG